VLASPTAFSAIKLDRFASTLSGGPPTASPETGRTPLAGSMYLLQSPYRPPSTGHHR